MLLTDLFASTVARHPELPAIELPPGKGRASRLTVTYAQLAHLSSQVAAALTQHVAAESMVVVLLPRTSAWLYAAQIGALQAGAAHVCLDPSFPDAHFAHVVRDARAVAIVTDATGAERCRAMGLPVVVVPLAATAVGAPASSPRSPQSLAYCIYTSGTTGLPKGVLIEHAGVVNLITQGVARFRLGPGDRIAQGSSAAYDSSIEETWLALASGATIVPLDDETVRLGPDLVPWLRRERVTVFCPPPTLLRAMDVRSPRAELPDLRLCYVGGEALPADLADLWGGELWLENGYGPTECTVTVVRGRVHPQQPVTIGEPVPPHAAHVLDERLQPVAEGQPGELCIAGPGLARGYLGLPELTAQRFPVLPGIGRVYRTGDAVTRLADGRLAYHGRLDAQVKVRGYRIELEAIETVLARCEGVREVACCAQDEGHERVLAAHVVPAVDGEFPDFVALADAVRANLPEYMVPARFSSLATLPRTIGGKIDRKALPRVESPAPAAGATAAWQPANAAESQLQEAFAVVLGVPTAVVLADSDFFALGGDSLRAALLVSRLRRSAAGSAIAVRDVYSLRTPAGLAGRLQGEDVAAAAAMPSRPNVLPPVPWLALAVQVAFLAVLLVATSWLAWVIGFVALPWFGRTFTLTQLLLVGPWFAAAAYGVYAVVSLWLAVAAKELLVGRYPTGRVRVWGGFYVRHWLVVRLVRLVPWSLFEGTELQLMALRALGARVGKRVHIHRGTDLLRGGWDLLELGDDATLLREVQLGVCELDDGHLLLGNVRIGAGATMATRAGTGPDVHVGDGAVVGALSYVPRGGVVPAGEAWNGVPAVRTGEAPAPAVVNVGGREMPPWRYTALLVAGRLLQAPLVALPFTAAVWIGAAVLGVDAERAVRWLCGDGPSSNPAWIWFAVALSVLALPLSLLARALVLRWSPRVPEGTHARWSWTHVCLQVRMEMLETAGSWLAGTLFWPAWLRLAGMRVGPDVEISTILDVLPEHLTLGGGSFLADGIYLGVPHHHRGRITVAPAVLGERSFLGNHVVIDAGQRLPSDIVLGVCTVGDDSRMRAGTGWFGLPPFALPRREVRTLDRSLTHAPGALRYANRVAWELLRCVLPALPMWLALWWLDAAGDASAGFELWRAVGATLAYGVVLTGTVLATKWLLLGRVRPREHGLWSSWASRWDFHYVLWERYGRVLLQQLEGTLLLSWFLRAIGMRIGKRCVLGEGFAQVVDPDMLSIGDGATVHAMFQAHSFEDRVLKMDHVHVGAGSTVGCAAVVLYGADIRDGARVMPHSVVMKHELLLPGRAYAGAPTVEIERREVEVAATAMPAAGSAGAERGREAAFDVARGLAVLGMVWMHFVPEPVEGAPASWWQDALGWSVQALEGLPATLFVLLAGLAWGSAGRRTGSGGITLRTSWVVRRSACLAAVGIVFWILAWPNDVLTPMAIMLPAVALLLRAGRSVLVTAILALLTAVPFVTASFGGVVATDCLADGTHLANHAFGWCTLRYFTFDGAYPLLPWLAIAAFGGLLALSAHDDASRWRRWLWLALPAAFVATGIDLLVSVGGDEFGDLTPFLTVTWQPTSLLFVAHNGGLALAIVALLMRRRQRRGLPRFTAPLAAVGRASLTHYLGHILLVYAPMRLWWPAENWSAGVGLVAALGYAAAALSASTWWFRRARRGPLESLLARASGPVR